MNIETRDDNRKFLIVDDSPRSATTIGYDNHYLPPSRWPHYCTGPEQHHFELRERTVQQHCRCLPSAAVVVVVVVSVGAALASVRLPPLSHSFLCVCVCLFARRLSTSVAVVAELLTNFALLHWLVNAVALSPAAQRKAATAGVAGWHQRRRHARQRIHARRRRQTQAAFLCGGGSMLVAPRRRWSARKQRQTRLIERKSAHLRNEVLRQQQRHYR